MARKTGEVLRKTDQVGRKYMGPGEHAGGAAGVLRGLEEARAGGAPRETGAMTRGKVGLRLLRGPRGNR